MSKENNFALLRKTSCAVEKATPGAKRILFGIIADTLAIAKREHIAQTREKFRIGDFEFDREVFTAAIKLANLYVKGGVTTFERFAQSVKEEMPSIWNQTKIYLRGVWNQVADMNGLREVSRDEARAIFAALEQPAEKSL